MFEANETRREYLASVGDLTIYIVLDEPDNASDCDVACRAPHSHPYHELFACGKGTLSIKTDSGLLNLQEGDILLIPSQFSHLKIGVSEDSEWYSVGFACSRHPSSDGGELYPLIDSLNKPHHIRKYTNAQNIFDEIKAFFEYRRDISKYIPAVRMFLILTELCEKSSINLEADNNRNIQHGKPEQMSLLTYLDYFVYHRFSETIPASEIAKQLFISERHLARIAKNRYGTTLHRAINEKRINTAAELLIGTDDTVEQVAYSVGFRSLACFYREFFQKFGMKPLEYRQINEKNNHFLGYRSCQD